MASNKWQAFAARKDWERQQREAGWQARRDEEAEQVKKDRIEFLRWFEQEVAETTRAIEDLADCASEHTTAIAAELDEMGKRIVWIGKRLSVQSLLLDDFDMRRTQKMMVECEKCLTATRARLMPSKPFEFVSKERYFHEVQQISVDLRGEPLADGERNSSRTEHDSSVRIESQSQSVVEVNVAGQDVYLANLKDCNVLVSGNPTALRLDDIRDSRITVEPVAGSIWASRCASSQFRFAGRQLRIHDSTSSLFVVYVPGGPIIENCEDLEFAPNEAGDGVAKPLLEAAGLLGRTNNWDQVKDFNWLRCQASPHWRVRVEGSNANV